MTFGGWVGVWEENIQTCMRTGMDNIYATRGEGGIVERGGGRVGRGRVGRFHNSLNLFRSEIAVWFV